MLTVLKNVVALTIVVVSFYFGLTIEAMPVLGGLVHLPSAFLVAGVTLGISLLIIDAADVARFARFLLTLSSDKAQRQTRASERSIESLVDVYAESGAEAMRQQVARANMPKIWSIVATKLAINVPIGDVKDILDFQIGRVLTRVDQDIAMLRQLAAMAPAIGLLGTVMGLIKLLHAMKDFDALGVNMALALLTTLYGIFIGNVIFVPLVNCVEKRKIAYLKNHATLMYWLEHVEQKRPSFYLKTRLRDLDVKAI